jgi:lipoyl(octanoyl) transferase
MNERYLSELEWLASEGHIEYEVALTFMTKRVEEIINGNASDMIWLLEHPSIYTAGISAKDQDMICNPDNIPIFNVNRGGKYTYHGPGVMIIYIMIDLKKFFYPKAPDIAKFVNIMENWVIEILSHYNIKGEIRNDRVGVWVNSNQLKTNSIIKEEKIAAMGIKVKKWVTYHGIAINLNPNLANFSNIIPCGIKEFGVTSIKELLGESYNSSHFQHQKMLNIAQISFEKIANNNISTPPPSS